MSRPTRIHAARTHEFLSWPVALCDNSGFHTTTPDPSRVTCKRCLAKTPRVSEIGTTISHTTEHTQ